MTSGRIIDCAASGTGAIARTSLANRIHRFRRFPIVTSAVLERFEGCASSYLTPNRETARTSVAMVPLIGASAAHLLHGLRRVHVNRVSMRSEERRGGKE